MRPTRLRHRSDFFRPEEAVIAGGLFLVSRIDDEMMKNSAPGSERREEVCAACGNGFGCGVNAASCWCSEISLTESALAQLAGRFEGCLCRNCLARFSADAPANHPDPAP